MTENYEPSRASGEHDVALAKLAEQIAQKLHAGEPLGHVDLIIGDSALSDSIRGFLPTLHDLAALGRSVSRVRRARQAGHSEDRR